MYEKYLYHFERFFNHALKKILVHFQVRDLYCGHHKTVICSGCFGTNHKDCGQNVTPTEFFINLTQKVLKTLKRCCHGYKKIC